MTLVLVRPPSPTTSVVRQQLAGAAWVKAVALRDGGAAVALAGQMVKLSPQAKPLLGAFLRASDAASRAREAAFVLARRTYPPLLLPLASLLGGVPPPPDQSVSWAWGDPTRAWWCGVGHRLCSCPPTLRCDGCDPLWGWEGVRSALPAFLNEQQRAEVQREWAALEVTGSGAEFLGVRALEWVQDQPSDPRVPEVLQRAVEASRWACEGNRVGDISRRAFRVLHTRYADSPQAEQTKYWYRGR